MNENKRNLDQLRAAVDAKTNPPVYRTSKEQLIDYYIDKAGVNWTRAIAEALHGSIKNKQGENVSIKNIQRRFQGGREVKGAGRSSAIYQKLGESLPALKERSLKDNSITIHIEGEQQRFGGPKGHRRVTHTSQRSIDITLTGPAAQDFIDEPDFDALWDEYGVDLGDDGEYSLQGANVS